MEAVLLVAHGSRAKETEVAMETMAQMVRNQINHVPIEVGYMEFCEKTIIKGLESLAKQGATKIKVIPYFLFEGIHIKKDIPEEISKFLEENKDIEVTLENTLGTDPRLAEILVDRIGNI